MGIFEGFGARLKKELERVYGQEILDKEGKPLSKQEVGEYIDDVFDGGIPMSKEHAAWLSKKWGERLGLKLCIKTCSCGLAFTKAEWDALRLGGYYDDSVITEDHPEPERLELRTCASCGSTIAVKVALDKGR